MMIDTFKARIADHLPEGVFCTVHPDGARCTIELLLDHGREPVDLSAVWEEVDAIMDDAPADCGPCGGDGIIDGRRYSGGEFCTYGYRAE